MRVVVAGGLRRRAPRSWPGNFLNNPRPRPSSGLLTAFTGDQFLDSGRHQLPPSQPLGVACVSHCLVVDHSRVERPCFDPTLSPHT